MSYTYALLEVSAAAYCEIRRLLQEADHGDALDASTGEIDMHGIALVRKPNSRLQKLDRLYDGPDPKIRRRHAL